MKKTIIIPIYLRLNASEELPNSKGIKLAKRAIESLKGLRDQDFSLILPVCFDTGRAEQGSFLEMDRLLRNEFRKVRLQKTLIFSSSHLERLRKYLGRKNFRNRYSLIDLRGFSKVRNTGLLLAQALATDVVIFIDNDEVVEDPNYLEVACEYMNETCNGNRVGGKGGFYINPDGTIFLPSHRLWWRFLWNKTKWMNRVWEKILSSEARLVPSPMILGGNLVLHRNLFNRVPFDPYIPRGEDTDYLINASHLGFCLLFDKELRIKHLHPERTEAFYQEELRGDIERFLYEREKTKGGLLIDLDPYPGYFLKWSLYPRAVLTSAFLCLDYLMKGEWKRARECIAPIQLLFKKKNEVWPKYLNFKADWERVMGDIQEEGMNEILEECWT
jgi:glycosyltransferase involved in cell wall biosynthesis